MRRRAFSWVADVFLALAAALVLVVLLFFSWYAAAASGPALSVTVQVESEGSGGAVSPGGQRFPIGSSLTVLCGYPSAARAAETVTLARHSCSNSGCDVTGVVSTPAASAFCGGAWPGGSVDACVGCAIGVFASPSCVRWRQIMGWRDPGSGSCPAVPASFDSVAGASAVSMSSRIDTLVSRTDGWGAILGGILSNTGVLDDILDDTSNLGTILSVLRLIENLLGGDGEIVDNLEDLVGFYQADIDGNSSLENLFFELVKAQYCGGPSADLNRVNCGDDVIRILQFLAAAIGCPMQGSGGLRDTGGLILSFSSFAARDDSGQADWCGNLEGVLAELEGVTEDGLGALYDLGVLGYVRGGFDRTAACPLDHRIVPNVQISPAIWDIDGETPAQWLCDDHLSATGSSSLCCVEACGLDGVWEGHVQTLAGVDPGGVSTGLCAGSAASCPNPDYHASSPWGGVEGQFVIASLTARNWWLSPPTSSSFECYAAIESPRPSSPTQVTLADVDVDVNVTVTVPEDPEQIGEDDFEEWGEVPEGYPEDPGSPVATARTVAGLPSGATQGWLAHLQSQSCSAAVSNSFGEQLPEFGGSARQNDFRRAVSSALVSYWCPMMVAVGNVSVPIALVFGFLWLFRSD